MRHLSLVLRHSRFGSRLRTLGLLCSSACSVWTASPLASAQPAPAKPSAVAPAKPLGANAPLPDQIAALIDKSQLGENVALSIVDTSSGRNLVAHRAQAPQNPASNLKLLTAATALLELGPEFRTQTSLYGRVQGDHVVGGLCVKGQADPTLTRADFAFFAQRLLEEGVHDIDDLIIDGSYFDAQILPPAFEQQPNESAPFRAAVAAVSVNANTYTLRLRPGLKDGAPATVTIDGSGYFDLDNALTTSATKTNPDLQISERDLGDRMAIALRGSLPLNGTTTLVYRRVASPLHFAGQVLIDALVASGIKVPLRARIGTCAKDSPLLLQQNSAPLGQVLSRLGKESDNFVAEMLLKIIGAERTHKAGSTADGIAVVQSTLRKLKLPCDNITLVNGSGLFQGNLVTTDLLSQLLLMLYRNPSLRTEFVAHLAVGGVDGTLAKRFRSLPVTRIVRAKTGTLDDVIALSGFILGPNPDKSYVFSYLATGITGKQPQARELIDQVVSALAAQLYKRRSASR
ncbi:MAG: hypothetical protein RL701_2482 [Pseudomonadota bacterium]|jgi:D-alanyl-D-alanine carboxypeptidase/D-alanyl-D-alanine-endopeptidase (penicillin-binding protein 4)